MQTRTKLLVGLGLTVVFAAAVGITVTRRGGTGTEVRTAVVARRDLVQVVTASGSIRARRTVDVSSDVSARVAELFVQEGDDVVQGQELLRLESDSYEAALARAEATLAQAEARESQERANLLRAQRDRDRFDNLMARDSMLVSQQQLDDARTNVELAAAAYEAARFGVSQSRASLREAQDLASKTLFTAPMDGKVTRLNVEEGETVVIGTMNNPGSLVLTIADLSVIEAVVEVDETQVSLIELGDSASVRIDAFPDRRFTGTVTRIGTSAVNTSSQPSGTEQTAVDFEVVVQVDETDVLLRPDLSATADIVVERREAALAVPIIALTVRNAAALSAHPSFLDANATDVEGVFVVRGGRVTFVPVELGITGRDDFEIIEGLQEGDTVVAGPYQRIRELETGDEIREMESER